MSISSFKHVKVNGVITVIPENFINIDDEIHFFENDHKKLSRAKAIIGFGKRYIADENTTVVDMGVYAANSLIDKLNVDKNSIDLLIFVNQKPDYEEPTDASIAHGLLNLSENCASMNLNHGCTGYVQGLWLAFSLIEAKAAKRCLLIAGDIPARDIDISDRVRAPVFGDAASATLISYSEEINESFFNLGSRGKNWNTIIHPVGGRRVMYSKENIDQTYTLENGETYKVGQGILNGLEVFKFTMEVAPKLIYELLEFSNIKKEDIDLFAIHQANKQIVDNIINKAQLPKDKTPDDVFSLYANNSTTSVATVLSEHLKPEHKKILLCSFGIGLNWAGAIINTKNVVNLGICFYHKQNIVPNKIEDWLKLYMRK